MKRVIVTVGPAIINGCGLENIKNLGDYIYRINGAHGNMEHIESYIDYIYKHAPYAEILLDLPGNKIRTKNIITPLSFHAGESLRFNPDQFNYKGFFNLLKPNTLIYANDGLYCFEVLESNEEVLTVKAVHSGVLTDNKGFYSKGVSRKLPFFFEKDLALIDVAKKKGVKYLGLSFVRSVEDVKIAESHVNNKCELMTKVETADAVSNLSEILKYSKNILIDRGDLAGEIGIVNTPFVIEEVLRRAKTTENKVFIATQYLKFMEHSPIPLLSEVNDLYNTMKLDIEGIQLSEETAVGAYPVRCLQLINDIRATLDKKIDELSVG